MKESYQRRSFDHPRTKDGTMKRFHFDAGKLYIVGAVVLFAMSAPGRAAEPEKPAAPPTQAKLLPVYFGTYTGTKSKGIYFAKLNLVTGELSTPVLAAETARPSFLALHPTRPLLYAVGEVSTFQNQKAGAVNAFSIDPATGMLALLNQQPSGGGGPCHLVVDRTGQHVLVANYGGGSVASLPIDKEGKLGPATSVIQHAGSSVNKARQNEPHAHSINLDAGNRFAVAADLGIDKLLVYRFDAAKGTLAANDPPFCEVSPGAGPRHFAFHPAGRFAYVINELHSTVTALAFDADRGALEPIQTLSTLPEGEKVPGNSTAEVQVHPSGKFLYGSNRGHDSIAIFSVDAATGKLAHVGNEPTGGKTPRNFGIDPTGTFLLAANQNSDTVVVFRIDRQAGKLAQVGSPVEVPSPVCVKFAVEK
jgi:6-phosphogluconolactonase